MTPTGHEQVFYLGPHAPRLTPKEIDLLHKTWLEFSEKLPKEELHHHDIVHFALEYLGRAAAGGQGDDILRQLLDHLHEIEGCRSPTQDSPPKADSQAPSRNEKGFFRLKAKLN